MMKQLLIGLMLVAVFPVIHAADKDKSASAPVLSAGDAAKLDALAATAGNINLLQCQANAEALQKAVNALLAQAQRALSDDMKAKYGIPADLQLDWATHTFVKPPPAETQAAK